MKPTKKLFGEYNFLIKKIAKKHGYSLEDVCRIFHSGDKPGIISPEALGADVEYLVLKGEAIPLHVFIEDESLSLALPEMIGEIDIRSMEVLWQNFGSTSAAIVHTCGEKRLGILLFQFVNGGGQKCIFISDGRHAWTSTWDDFKTSSYEHVRLVFALGAYMEAFPDCIKKGFPGALKFQGHFSTGPSVKISIHPKMRTHDSPSAHIRKGHIRYLKAPRFTNKRFTCVWVASAIVGGGQAITVESPK